MPIPLRILILDDKVSTTEALIELLRKEGFETRAQQTGNFADLTLALDSWPDVIFARPDLAGVDLSELFKLLNQRQLLIPVFVLLEKGSAQEVSNWLPNKAAGCISMGDPGLLRPKILDAMRRKKFQMEEEIKPYGTDQGVEPFSTLSDLIPFDIWICAPGGGVVYLSDSFLQVAGVNIGAFAHAGWTNRIPEKELEAITSDWNRTLLSGRFRDHENTIVDANGKNHIILSRGVPIRGADGTITSWIGISVDITEGKQSDAELRASEERFRLIIDGVKDYAIFMLDLEGRVVTWNDGARRTLGYEAEEIYGKHLSTFFPPEDAWKAEKEILTASIQGRSEKESWRMAKGGVRFWADEIITALHDKDGTLCGFAKVIRDLTERKIANEHIHDLNTQLEKRVAERTAELEEAYKELEAFTYSVSHDLRSPLRAINGFSRILLRNEHIQLPPDAREYLELVSENATRMGLLIDELLKFSRLSRQPLKDEALDCGELAYQAISELKAEQEGRNVEFTVGELQSCHGDGVLLKQVFINLISNALKFTSKHELARIEIGCDQVNDEKVYFVRDDGAGFDMKYANRLFGVFQRLHSPSEYEGTGVGLAIVQRILKRHGGRIWAEAETDHGATFYFTIGALGTASPLEKAVPVADEEHVSTQ